MDLMRLHDYLHRIGLEENLAPTIDALRRLHLAHRETFIFENLSIQCGIGISLALGDLERKFLDDDRGGYCFEHNTLFAAVLRDIGFTPATLLGRVRRGPPERWCRTHMVLRVPVAGEVWFADVGFGAAGTLEPLPLEHGARAAQSGFEYVLRREDHLWVLSMRDAASATQDLYEFSDDPQTPWGRRSRQSFHVHSPRVGVSAHADDSAELADGADRAARRRPRTLSRRPQRHRFDRSAGVAAHRP